MENFSGNIVHKEISLDGFLEFINLAKELDYNFIFYNEHENYNKYILLRHDVDFGVIDYAYDMAKIEYSNNVKSTYFFMLRNPLYNLFEKKNSDMIREISDMGHNIGLHFDPSFYSSNSSVAQHYSFIWEEIKVLSKLFDKNINYFSVHKPLDNMIENDIILLNKFESVYNKKYFKDIKYMSDSCGRWRGPSIIELLKSKRYNKIQLLIHPALWIEPVGKRLKDRINSIIKKRCDNIKTELKNTLNDTKRKLYLI